MATLESLPLGCLSLYGNARITAIGYISLDGNARIIAIGHLSLDGNARMQWNNRWHLSLYARWRQIDWSYIARQMLEKIPLSYVIRSFAAVAYMPDANNYTVLNTFINTLDFI